MNYWEHNRHKIPAKYTGILDRPTYKALRRSVKRYIDEMFKDYGYISIQPTYFTSVKVNDRSVGLGDKTVIAVWGKIASDLGLYDDGTGSNTWTVKGKEMPEINMLRAYAIQTGRVR